MTTTSVTNFRKNVFDYVGNVIRFTDPVHITTRDGSAVLISEEDYNSMIATLELARVPGLVEEIKAAGEAPDDEYVPAEELGW